MMTTPKIAEKSKPQKCLRSLNDVLGKASSLCKDTKPASGIVFIYILSEFLVTVSLTSPVTVLSFL